MPNLNSAMRIQRNCSQEFRNFEDGIPAYLLKGLGIRQNPEFRSFEIIFVRTLFDGILQQSSSKSEGESRVEKFQIRVQSATRRPPRMSKGIFETLANPAVDLGSYRVSRPVKAA